MNEDQLREMLAARTESPHVQRMEVSALHCYGCAHAAASVPPPGGPSGERPCMGCVRNPDRPWEAKREYAEPKVDDEGNARIFDPFLGAAYNGMPMIHHPMDRYVTLDSMDQEDWAENHPGYGKPVTIDNEGNVRILRG